MDAIPPSSPTSLPAPPLPPVLSFPSLLPLKVGPLNTARCLGRCKLPGGVWGEAPADKGFGAHLSQKEQVCVVGIFFVNFLENEYNFSAQKQARYHLHCSTYIMLSKNCYSFLITLNFFDNGSSSSLLGL